MGYFLTSEPENAVPGNFFASPKTHVPLSRLQERGHRYYNPELSRWASLDPIGELGGVNLYCFVANSPLSKIDPFGLDSPACDVPGWAKKIADANDCYLKCCAKHDKCYADNKCKAWSWCWSGVGTYPFSACSKCNVDAATCFVGCNTKWKPKDPKGKYYCGKHDVWFDDPSNPHMTCSTDK